MKIIEPSAEIIEDELANLSIYQRIAYCAGVCYQREPNKTEEEAQAFCRKMMKIGHMSTLEMAVVHLVCSPPWNIPTSDFVKFQAMKNSITYYAVTGSIRALIESEYSDELGLYLANNFPVFFTSNENIQAAEAKARFALPHEIPWHHKHVAVRFIVNRAVSHELVRHRPMSFLQESQRYCRYEDEVVFIMPEWFRELLDRSANIREDIAQRTWSNSVTESCQAYKRLLECGKTPQQARAVLPNSTKTELIAYASLPQWKHMFNLRCSPAADPEMRKIMIPLRDQFKTKYPEVEI